MTALLPPLRDRFSRTREPGRDQDETAGPGRGDQTGGPETDKASRRSALRERVLTWLPVVLVLVGVAVLLYPVMATQHNNGEQQRLADMYTATIDSTSPDTIAQERQSAEAYNDQLESAPILDPWLESQRPDTPQYQAYLHEMDIDPVMARIVIPSIHVSLPVYHGTDTRTLANGVGHLFGTSLPIGGPSTHAVLTGHTGLPTATMFDNLNQVKKGDAFYVSSLGQTLKYEVVDITVVTPEETDSLRKVPGRDLVTLITCTPYGVNSHRLLVTGERVPMDPTAAAAEEAEALPAPMQTWMKVIIVAVVIILAVVVGILGRLWWLRRRARLASREEGASGASSADGRTDAAGGTERWPGRHLKDVAGFGGDASGERQGNPLSDVETREP
ncbi:class C sortase [Actinomyces viscosus]|uniref:Sortase (Surface protein transpeptidase) n=1 Tax=Actinomyces viscosus TaxID=1656 RepID=Q9AJ92_ACTVI|nr:class C sortase [Actinomyces viscosus]AAK30625.1 sortase-like protein [Actinomyces viscosus]TFH51529.1 class C sortase [Actinomyces viscosus]VEI16958.1 Sortase (surface protein transpeptidase) [Actinomyces viscosus]